ncbi:MAG: tyrosine-type recombinase/integrase [Paludibacter sp.]|nr:tyrosine-type recombinase/integrase [Paludibacter sp.]
MINEFLQYIQYEKNYSSHTVLSYHTDLIQFLSFLKIAPENFNPDSILAEHIRQWILNLLENKVSARSISRKISTLKSFWKFLKIRGYTTKNPTLKIILPKTKKPLPAFFKKTEMSIALDETFLPEDFESQRDHLIIETFYNTGMRLSELITIKDADLDAVENTLKVTGKRNKQRVIPLSKEFCVKLVDYMRLRDYSVENTTSYLFVRNNGMKLYPKMVYNMVHSRMQEVSSLSKVSPHVLRHTFATELLNEGADINAVKELLGHSSLAATQVYTHTSFGELQNIYKHAHPRAK